MRFVEIPAELLPTGTKKVTFHPIPGNEETTQSLSVALGSDTEYGHRCSFLLEFDDSDLVELAKSRRLWMHQFGTVFQPVACGPIAECLHLDGPIVAGNELRSLGGELLLEARRLDSQTS